MAVTENEEVLVELELFRHGLDDEARSCEIFELQRRRKARDDFFLLLGAELAALPAALKKAADSAQAFVDELLRDVVNQSLETRLRGDLRDARAHGPGA
jgi:hypothetical protein